MESIFLDVIKKMVSESLAPLLMGALGAIVFLNFQWKIPDKLRVFDNRLARVEKRQKLILAILDQQAGKSVDINRLERIASEGTDDDEAV